MRLSARLDLHRGSARRAAILTFGRFAAVGASGYVVNLSVFALLVDVAHTPPIAAAVVAFIVALLSNFVLNRFWTFAAAGPRARGQLVRYAIVSTASFGLNVLVLAALIDAGVGPIVSESVAFAWVAPVNFVMCRRWVFHPSLRSARASAKTPRTGRGAAGPVDRRPPRHALTRVDFAVMLLLVGATAWLAKADAGPLLTIGAAVLAFAFVVRRAVPSHQKRAAILTAAVAASVFEYLVWRAGVINWHAAWLSVPLYAAEVFAAVHILGFHFTLWPRQPPPLADDEDPTTRQIFIFIPTVNEGVDVLAPTLTGASAARERYLAQHPHGSVTIIVCNDGGVAGAGCSGAVEALCREVGVRCVTRTVGGGAKAGNLEHARQLTGATGDALLVIFDADQVATPEFLLATIPGLRDSSVAWVQTGQFYGNLENPVARWANDQQGIFYKVLCEGKAACNAAFICGTNVVIRAEALDEIGGFPQTSVTEDFAASIVLHQRWRSVFLPGVLAVGLGPVELAGYLGQQRRWARGSVGVLRSNWRDIFLPRRRGGLRAEQRAEYALAGTHYFCGLRDLVYIAIPVVYLVTGISAVRGADLAQFLAHFVPFWVLTQIAFWHASRGKLYWRGVVMGFGSFPVLVPAALTALVKGGGAFTITAKRRVGTSTVRQVAVHIVCLIACTGAIVAAGFRGFNAATQICVFWAAYTGVLLSMFIGLAALDHRVAHRSVFNWTRRPSRRRVRAWRPALAGVAVAVLGVAIAFAAPGHGGGPRLSPSVGASNPRVGLDFTTDLVAQSTAPDEWRLGDRPGLIERTQEISDNFSRSWAHAIALRGGRPWVNLLFTAPGRPIYEASLPSITNGLHDGDLRRWAGEIAAWRMPVDLTILQHLDRNWVASSAVTNGGIPGDAARAWDHVRDVFRASGATNVTWIWAPADPGADSPYAPPMGNYGAVLISLIEYPNTRWVDPATEIARVRLRHPDTPLLIETSVDGPTRKRSNWLHRLGLAAAASNDVAALIYHEGGPLPVATPAQRAAWSLGADPHLAAAFQWAARRLSASPYAFAATSESNYGLATSEYGIGPYGPLPAQGLPVDAVGGSAPTATASSSAARQPPESVGTPRRLEAALSWSGGTP